MKRGKIKIGFNFRVGFISIWVGFILNGYAISFPSCKKKKKKTSIKNLSRHQSVNHVYTKLTEINERTNGVRF